MRFKPEGEYKVDLSLKDTQAQELIKIIKQYQIKAVNEAKEKSNNKTIKEHNPPYKKDEEGNVISEGVDSHVEEEHYYEGDEVADAPSDATYHYRLGIRYSELLAFIISAL